MASVHTPTASTSGEMRLEMPERFDFTASRGLIAGIRRHPGPPAPSRLCLDFAKTRYIDTTGLGCLLVIAEHFGAETRIVIEGATGAVRQLIDMAQLDFAPSGASSPRPDLRLCSTCRKPADAQCGASLHEARACPRAGLARKSAAPQLPRFQYA